MSDLVKVNAIIPAEMRDELHHYKTLCSAPVQDVVQMALGLGLKCMAKLESRGELRSRLKPRASNGRGTPRK